MGLDLRTWFLMTGFYEPKWIYNIKEFTKWSHGRNIDVILDSLDFTRLEAHWKSDLARVLHSYIVLIFRTFNKIKSKMEFFEQIASSYMFVWVLNTPYLCSFWIPLKTSANLIFLNSCVSGGKEYYVFWCFQKDQRGTLWKKGLKEHWRKNYRANFFRS